MKKSKNQLPVELKHILNTIGVADGDVTAVERRVKERAALQVQDYIEVIFHKISQFHGVEISTDMHETMHMLQQHTRLRSAERIAISDGSQPTCI
jgi:hypothetical protein